MQHPLLPGIPHVNEVPGLPHRWYGPRVGDPEMKGHFLPDGPPNPDWRPRSRRRSIFPFQQALPDAVMQALQVARSGQGGK